MANENKEIGDIVKKCKILLLDIEGTTTSISFVKDKLFPYAVENVKQFLENHWEDDDVKEAVTGLRNLALQDEKNSMEGLVAIPGEDASKEDQIEGIVNNVKWQMSSDRKAGPLKHLQGLIWQQGFDKGDIKGHVYDDVSAALKQWHDVEGQKIYIYSSGSVQAQKLLFEKSLAGDLLPYIDGHFDTSIGAKQEAASYKSIIENIGCKPDEILFLTDIPKEAEGARSAGMHAALVSREGNAPLTAEATDAFAVIHSFAQLAVSNKRKTDPQEEQPAKVPKTDGSNDVKTTEETKSVANETEAPATEKAHDDTEKMEVDEDNVPVKKDGDEEKTLNDVSAIVVQDVTDANEIDVPISDVEPIVTEVNEKSEETEKMETDATDKSQPAATEEEAKEKAPETAKSVLNENCKSVNNKKTDSEKKDKPIENMEEKPVEEKAPIAAETPPTTITEIEEITADKENLVEITDIEPVVEEPNSGEDLENVGEELEKECADILTKVQNVTNLDNIPVKSCLKPIPEESVDTEKEQLESEEILEKELDIEMKQCENLPASFKLDANYPKKLKRPLNEKKERDVKEKAGNEESVEEKAETVEQSVSNDMEQDKEKVVSDTENLAPVIEVKEKPKEKTKEETKTKDTNASDSKLEDSNGKVEITPERNEAESSIKEKSAVETDEKKITSTVGTNDSVKKDKPSSVTETKEDKSSSATEAKEDKSSSAMETKEDKCSSDKEAPENKPSTATSTTESKEDKPSTATSATDTKEETKTEEKPKENNEQVNGKTNGEAEVVQNGDASSDDLSTRLAVENGKEVNGANGDSMETENGKEEKQEAEIKVKTVPTEESRTEPAEQPTEA